MKKYRLNLKTLIINAWCLLSIIVVSWISVSWVEVLIKNLTHSPVYHNWNFFIWMVATFS